LDTIEERKNHQPVKKPPTIARGKSGGTAKSANSTLGPSEGVSNLGSKILENEQYQSQTPQSKLGPGEHQRRVSWGGKLIQIPQIFNDNSIPPLFPERPKNPTDDTKNEVETRKATRTKVASEIVSTIEATMRNEGIDVSTIISTKYEEHHQDKSSTPAIDIDDLAKVHPVESQAALGVLEDIESKDQQNQEDILKEEAQIEAVANLFSSSDVQLLNNVPKGAEDMFQKVGTAPPVPAITSNSISSQPSETMVASIEQSPTRGGRARINSVSQFSMASATSNSRRSIAGHNRTNTMASFRTITSGAKSPLPQPNQNRRRHRRQETMEERLFSLNQALDAVDAPPSSQDSVSKRHDQEARKDPQENTAKYHHVPATSLDLFNQNLARLFQDYDGNKADYDEREMTPLAQNRAEVSAHYFDVNDISTSRTGNSIDQNENGPVTDDASIDNMLMPTEQNNTNELNQSVPNIQRISLAARTSSMKKFQEPPVRSKPNEDIEGGMYNHKASNVSTNDFTSSSPTHDGKMKRSKFRRFIKKIGSVTDMEYFFKLRTPSMLKYLKNLFWLILAATFFAAIMYYALGNPPIVYEDEVDNDKSKDEEVDDDEFDLLPPEQTCRYVADKKASKSNNTSGASYSWWTLYLFVRLPITFTMARFLEILLIHFMILDWRWLGSCIGSTVTLLIVQAKGWPAILFFWSICNLVFLYGKSPFVNHWGYWQSIELFNECNDSGMIIPSETNLKVQLIALVVSIVVAVKRLLIGFYQGRKTFLHYSEELGTLMTKILLISEISHLSLHLELEDPDTDNLSDSDSSNMGDRLHHPYKSKRSRITGIDSATEMLKRSIADEEVSMDGSQGGSSLRTSSTYKTNMTKNKLLINERQKELVTGLLSQSQKRRIERLLGSWEEPEKQKFLTDNVSIGAILQFRKSLSKLDSRFPFSYAFGKADMRDDCIQSSQSLYFRLLEKTPDVKLHFNILGLVALQSDGTLDQEKLKTLIKVFRPNRDGVLSLIDFVKSTDIVYKEMKLLRASVRSSQKIDKSFEKIFNILFYFVIMCVILHTLGYDPITVFLSLSSVVLAFSFMISQASSKYVEGLLFILYRRPYDIGDLIVIQPVDQPTSWDGSTEWIVRDINLFTTTVIFAYTNEIATLSNGSIANSRVMNGARSLPAIVYVTLRFGVDTSLDKIDIFREALSQYVERRPREWTKLLRITNRNVQADEGFVEYLVAFQHVNNWQHLDSIKTSRSQAKFFCHELSKQLCIRYKSPPLPVDLNVDKSLAFNIERSSGTTGSVEEDTDDNILPDVARLSDESNRLRNLIRDNRM